MAEMTLFKPDMFVWIDETGSEREECEKLWILTKGNTTTYTSTIFGGERVSAIPVLTTRGIEDLYTTTDSVNGESVLVPMCATNYILPFDG